MDDHARQSFLPSWIARASSRYSTTTSDSCTFAPSAAFSSAGTRPRGEHATKRGLRRAFSASESETFERAGGGRAGRSVVGSSTM